MTERLMERLRFSRHEIDRVVEAVRQHMVFKDVQNMRTAKLKRFMARAGFDEELELHRVDCQSSHGALDNYDFLKAKAGEFADEPLIPPPLVTGRDLLALGWTPGPHFGAVLDAVQTAQLEGTLTTTEEALTWIKTKHPR
jgi:poly(A) polymerase